MPEKGTDLHDLAEKLSVLLGKDGTPEPYVFSDDEVRDLKRVMTFVQRLDALGWWGKWAFYLVVTAGAVLVNWQRIVGIFK